MKKCDNMAWQALRKKWIKISSVNVRPNPQFPADFVAFTEEIFNGKLHFLCSEDIISPG